MKDQKEEGWRGREKGTNAIRAVDQIFSVSILFNSVSQSILENSDLFSRVLRSSFFGGGRGMKQMRAGHSPKLA